MQAAIEKVRIDKYLWAIRLFKTRSLASDACEKGRVRINGDQVKASRNVKVGDTIDTKTDTRGWKVVVKSVIEKRVAYQEAILHYIDETPVEEKEFSGSLPSSFNTGKRLSKIGRPTKKQRRDLGDVLDT